MNSLPTPKNSFDTKNALWLLLSLCVGVTTWTYVHRILGPWSEAKDLQKGGIHAQLWDLYPRWLGAQELLLHGRDPYSSEVSHEIQMAYYGHIVTEEESRQHVVDEQRFAYPIYVVFLMAPAIFTDFAKVQFWAPFVLGAVAGVSVMICVGLLRWRTSWTALTALVLFAVSSPQIVQGMRHQQLALVAACLLFAGAWCVQRGLLGPAGVLLAFSTIKPQMALLPLVWFLLWWAGEWRGRLRLALSFGITMALLVGAGEYLSPGWIGEFFAGMAAYRKYFPTTSVLRLLLGDWLGIALSVAIAVWLLTFAWSQRKAEASSQEFVWVFASFLMVTVLTFPLFTPFNQALLILPALLVLSEWENLPKISKISFAAVVSWPWISSAALLLLRIAPNSESRIPLIPAIAASAVPLLLPVILSTRKTHVDLPIRQGESR